MKFMYKVILLILATLVCAGGHAQTPYKLFYQGVLRSQSDELLANQGLTCRISIIDLSVQQPLWQEIQTVTTTQEGVIYLILGNINPLSELNWTEGEKFLRVEADSGSGFFLLENKQLTAVPYAIEIGNGFDYVSSFGDSLLLSNGSHLIVPGISQANITDQALNSSRNTCGLPNIHNPSFTYGSVLDQEGNEYRTIHIGNNEWMAENLNTSIYGNGDTILTGLNNYDWYAAEFGAYSFYENSASYECACGKLYNYYTVMDERGLCPSGWHVASDADWYELILLLGGEEIAGGKLKTYGNQIDHAAYWFKPNFAATNSVGFSGMPCGSRSARFDPGSDNSITNFYQYGRNAYWWSIPAPSDFPSFWSLDFLSSKINKRDTMKFSGGYSIRCVRD